MNKREYNSERRRKLTYSYLRYHDILNKIRENITPRGDGNAFKRLVYKLKLISYKREYNSERRRKLILFSIIIYIMNKREYNSERRRKHYFFFIHSNLLLHIRENITPRGDGNSRIHT